MNKLDLPLSHVVDDHFDRGDYARKLGDLIYKIDDLPSGYVIGIEGKWGSGKTSIINMIIEHLEHLQMIKKNKYYQFQNDNSDFSVSDLERISPRYKLVEHKFNYEICNYSYLSKQHFLNISCLDSDNENIDELYKYFRLYNEYKNAPNIIFVKFSPWMMPSGAALAATFLAELTRATKGHLGDDLQGILQIYAAKVASLVPIAGKLAISGWAGSAGLIEVIGTFIGRFATRQKSIEDVKATLEVRLRQLKDMKIVAVIDDLDRLPPHEAGEIMNLIKGLGHLPNVVYLLTYDQIILGQQLEAALKLTRGQGEEYLQKIIQLRRSLPRFTKEHFLEIVNHALAPYAAVADQNANHRLTYAWSDYVSKVMNTPREAQLLINSIKNFDTNIFEYTDISDLFLLQAIYLKDIKLYSFIKDNITILSSTEIKNPRVEEKFNSAMAETNCKKENIHGIVLSMLFPNVSNFLQVNQFLHAEKLAIRQRRLHVDSASDVYFNIITNKNQTSKILIDSILDSDDPESKLVEYISWIENNSDNQSFLRIELLSIIEDHFDSGEKFNDIWLNALFNVSDSLIKHFDQVVKYIGGGDNLQRLSRIILKGLDRNSSQNELMEGLERVFDRQQDISLFCSILTSLLSKTGIGRNFESKILNKIRLIADDKKVWEQNKPIEIIRLWRIIGGFSEVQNWLKTQIDCFSGLMQVFLLEDAFNPGVIRISSWEIDEELAFMLLDKANSILSDEANADYSLAQKFLKAYTNGKSNKEPYDV